MSKRNENRPGYKNSKVGWIPEEWECVRLGAMDPFLTSGSRGWAKYYSDSGSLFLRITNLKRENIHVDLSETRFVQVSSDCVEAHRTRVRPGDILISITADLGIIGFISEDIANKTAYINQHICLMRLQSDSCLQKYVALSLAGPISQRRFLRIVDQGAKAGLNLGAIRSFPIPLPPLPEQKKIAEILSAWDRGIEITNRLITNYELLKKGLMQQLLTGRIRFPEFGKAITNEELRITNKNGSETLPEGWSIKPISSIAQISFSGVDKKTHAEETPVRLCNYMDVYANDYITADLNFMPATASASEIERFALRQGDVMITKDSETPDDIGIPAIVTEKVENVVCGYHLALIRPNPTKVDPVFLSKGLGSAKSRKHFSTHANGATRFGLTTSTVMKTAVFLPPIKEQTRIAAVLSTCDREIELLGKKQGKLREQKKGLMQKLLTGEIRHPEFLKEGYS